MTIHASKGLEFDVVVLPDLDSDMVRKSQVLVATHRPSPDLPYERVCRLPKKALRALDPTLQAWGTERQEALYLESINLLYVALTRAKHRLEIVVGAKPSDASPAQAIKDALDLPDPSELEEPIRAAGSQGVLLGQETYGETWVPEVAQPAQAESSPPEPQAVQWSTTAPPPGSRTRSPSQGARRTRPEPRRGADLLRAAHGSNSASRGTLWHQWLEPLTWLEGDELPAPAISAPTDSGQAGWRDQFLAALRQPAIQALLTRPAGETRVYTERRFWWTDDDGVLWNGSIDRLVVTYESGQPAGAHVIDFKTGGEEATEAEVRERYGPQLEVYRRAAAAQFGLEVSAVQASLAMLDQGRVLPL